MEETQTIGVFLVVPGLLDAAAGVVLRGFAPAIARIFPLWIFFSLVIMAVGIGLLVT